MSAYPDKFAKRRRKHLSVAKPAKDAAEVAEGGGTATECDVEDAAEMSRRVCEAVSTPHPPSRARQTVVAREHRERRHRVGGMQIDEGSVPSASARSQKG